MVMNSNFTMRRQPHSPITSAIYIDFESPEIYDMIKTKLKPIHKFLDILEMATSDNKKSIRLICPASRAEVIQKHLMRWISALGKAMVAAIQAFNDTMEKYMEKELEELMHSLEENGVI